MGHVCEVRDCLNCEERLAIYCGKCVDAEREELNRLRRLVPTGTYTLTLAHEQEIRLLHEQLDEERANVEMLKTHVETLREAWHGSSEAVAKLGKRLNASEADCERLCKLLDDCRDVLLGQYDPDSVNAMIHRIDDAIGPWEALEKPSKEKRDG